ncbi:MAG: cytochrome C oxidase subunit IV family protein [Niabella sp.]|nr:cytochrome C oxidase subunit IV family protein [Niabella sp.]
MSHDTHTATSSEITFVHHMDDASFNRRILKTTIILSVFTLIELALGFTIYVLHKGVPSQGFLLLIKGVICILTLGKAFYIVSIFMHLGDEIRNFTMTILIPLMLFIWFIIAFLADGSSYKNLRNKYDPYFKESTTPAGHPDIPSDAHRYNTIQKGERQ